jgi:NAD(P)H-dependent FMN reductase
MSDKALSIAIIIGSNREGRLGDKVGAWVHRMAQSVDRFDIDIIDIANLSLPHDYPVGPNAAVQELRNRIAAADGFVVVTPEYNHSFPAPLKHAIDQAYDEWRAKPVAFVSYGGISGGLRAVEALRLVFAELQAVTLRDGVSFPIAWSAFGDDRPYAADAALQKAASNMFNQLAWWTTALAWARRELPLDVDRSAQAAE